MDIALQNALNDLKKAGAKRVPDEATVAAAKDGTVWSGQKFNGDDWSLTKHAVGSYHCAF